MPQIWPSLAPDGSRVLEIRFERITAENANLARVVEEWQALRHRGPIHVDAEFSEVEVGDSGESVVLVTRPGSRLWKDLMIELLQLLQAEAGNGSTHLLIDKVSGRARSGPWTPA
jgi:hypothetical protein